MERRFSQTMASEWQTAFVVSHKTPSRITSKILKNCKTFSSGPRPRPSVQDQDQDFHFLSSRRLETKTMSRGLHHCDFLLTFHSNHRPISHRFRDKRRFPSKIANFYHPLHVTPPLKGFPLELDIGARGQKAPMMGLPDGRNVLR